MVTESTTRPSLAPYPTYPLQHILTATAQRAPRKAAIIDGEHVYSYQQLDMYSNRFAAALAKLGVVKGDRVGLLAPNCVEFEIAFFGIIKLGAVVTTLNSGYREREIAHQLDNSGAKVLVVHESQLQMAEAARDGAPNIKRMVVIRPSSRESDSFWGLIERSPAMPPPVEIDAKEDLAALPYSSGTTGLSKGVMLTHFNMTANLRQFIERPGEALQQTERDMLLVHLPLFHIYGMQVLMNAVIATGGTQVMMGRFDMEEMLRLLSTHRITHLYTVPPVGIGLSLQTNLGEYDLSSMVAACLAAAPASEELQIAPAGCCRFPRIPSLWHDGTVACFKCGLHRT